MNRICVVSLIFSFCIAVSAGESPLVVDYCDDGNHQSALGGWWYTYDDSESGGNSVVLPKPNSFKMTGPGFGKKGYAAQMIVKVGDKLGWDFAGLGFTLTMNSGCPEAVSMDLREYTKIQFKMKGTLSGGRLIMNLPFTEKCMDMNTPVSLTEWADYEANLTGKLKPDWTTVTLDLRKDFHQPKWAKQNAIIQIDKVLQNAKHMNLHFSSPDGDSIEVWIDEIEFVK